MHPYEKVEVSEARLEDLVRQHPRLVEEGLVYVDHQKPAAGGRLDLLLMDSGRSLVVAELKVVQDDGMLFQGIDYYDHVASNLDTYARLYKTHCIDPTQPARLVLIAPTFSRALVNRCKWLDLPISLFTYQCLRLDGTVDVVPVFAEHATPTHVDVVEVSSIDDHLGYITDLEMRACASSLLDEIKGWKPGSISLDPIKYAISMRVHGRVFAYFYPRRKHYILTTYGTDGAWADYPVKDEADLANVKPIVRTAMDLCAAGALGKATTTAVTSAQVTAVGPT